MAAYKLRVNGRDTTVDSWDPKQPVLYLLRNELNLKGARFGCGLGQCGACTILVDGKPRPGCITTVQEAAGHSITTLEGLGTLEKPHKVQAAFIAEQAAQCGYCSNGMIMRAKALLDTTPKPTEEQVKQGMAPALCRCGTHSRIVSAVMRASRA